MDPISKTQEKHYQTIRTGLVSFSINSSSLFIKKYTFSWLHRVLAVTHVIFDFPCSLQDLQLWNANSACGISLLDQGSNPGPLHWSNKFQPLDHQESPNSSSLNQTKSIWGRCWGMGSYFFFLFILSSVFHVGRFSLIYSDPQLSAY